MNMRSVKIIVAYPQPKDVAAFEAVYQQEHVPMAIANLTDMCSAPAGNGDGVLPLR
jgi:hypothetical protein